MADLHHHAAANAFGRERVRSKADAAMPQDAMQLERVKGIEPSYSAWKAVFLAFGVNDVKHIWLGFGSAKNAMLP